MLSREKVSALMLFYLDLQRTIENNDPMLFSCCETVAREVLRDAGLELCVRIPVGLVVKHVLGDRALRYAPRSSIARRADATVSIEDGRCVIRVAHGLAVPIARFCVAHELGHVLLSHDIFGGEQIEREADYFAAALLMQPWAVGKLVHDYGLNLELLAEIFLVPQTAVALRLGEVGSVDASVVVARSYVRVRTSNEIVLPDEGALRQLASQPSDAIACIGPGIKKVSITDQRHRVMLAIGDNTSFEV